MSLWVALRALLAMATFFALVYVAYGCMKLGPVASLRRWGAETWWRLTQFGPGYGGG